MDQPDLSLPRSIQPGLTGTASLHVADQHTARHLGSGAVDVLATPQMILLMEQASVAAVDHLLPPGHRTVGARIDVQHLAPTPTGYHVQATAELIEVQGRRLTFRVQVHEQPPHTAQSGAGFLAHEDNIVGTGTHQRVIIDLKQFGQRLQQRNVLSKTE